LSLMRAEGSAVEVSPRRDDAVRSIIVTGSPLQHLRVPRRGTAWSSGWS
jgi:hypothetical protein